jgi:hypothetical protein
MNEKKIPPSNAAVLIPKLNPPLISEQALVSAAVHPASIPEMVSASDSASAMRPATASASSWRYERQLFLTLPAAMQHRTPRSLISRQAAFCWTYLYLLERALS